MSKNDGGSAFPVLEYWDESKREYVTAVQDKGMPLRDWFAGQALAGMADYAIKDDDMAWSDLARNCYRVADAMLAEREK